MTDLFSSDYFAKKLQRTIATANVDSFEDWTTSGKERFKQTKLEPMLQTYRLSDHEEFKNFHRRRGECMHYSDLIYRLQKLNPNLFVQQSINFPDDCSIYEAVGGRIQYLSAIPKTWLTEFSYAIVDDRDLPLEERRGWRTVIVMCLMKGAVQWEETIAEFGEPEDAWNEARWYDATRDFRFGGDGIVARNQGNLVDS